MFIFCRWKLNSVNRLTEEGFNVVAPTELTTWRLRCQGSCQMGPELW